MVFSVTYHLELRNAIIVYYAFHLLSIKVELVVWISVKHQHLYLVRNYTNNIKI